MTSEKFSAGEKKLRDHQKRAVLLNYKKNKEGREALNLLQKEGVEFSTGVNGLNDDEPILRVEFGDFGFEELKGFPEIRTFVKSKL